MFGLAGLWSFLFDHPIVGLAVFAIVSAGVIVALSGGRLGESLASIIRIISTIFTTPFEFLRDALRLMRTSSDDEHDYAQSSVFMLFRLNRIQYMALLVICLLILSGGVTTAVLSLYPQAEIEQGRALDAEITRIDAELAAATEAVAAASAPGFREDLAARRNEARATYQQQVLSNAEFAQNTTFTGPAIDRLRNARSAEIAVGVRDNIDNYMSSCPRGWRGMTPETCMQYRAFVLDLADRRLNEFSSAQAANDADAAWRQADFAAQAANNQMTEVQARLERTRQQRAQVDPFDPDRMMQRIWGALLMVLGTLWSVIVIVWVGATLIDLLNWIVLMMRSMEKTQLDKLERARGDPT